MDEIRQTAKGHGVPRQIFYALMVVALPLTILVLAIPLSATDWFLRQGNDWAFLTLGYGRTLVGANCDVVVYGDSSAMTGIMPAVVEQRTGLKTCNIAEVGPVRMVGEAPTLDAYLQQNRRPRYIVFQYVPWDYHVYSRGDWNAVFSPMEGINYLIRFEPASQSLSLLLRHPKLTVQYASWVLQSELEQMLVQKHPLRAAGKGWSDPISERIARQGAYVLPLPAEQRCDPERHLHAESVYAEPEWVAGLRAWYAGSAEHVLMDLAPIPNCEPVGAVVAERLRGLYDNRFMRLPITMFNHEDTHFDEQGAEIVSGALAEQILDVEAREQGKAAGGR